jgi:hypothetical protein
MDSLKNSAPIETPGSSQIDTGVSTSPNQWDAILKQTPPKFGVSSTVKPTANRTEAWRQHLQAQINQLVVPVDLTLPSGVSVLAVRPHLLLMYRHNVFPNFLTPLVEKLIQSAKDDDDGAEEFIEHKIETEAVQAYNEFMALLDYVWVTAIVDPIFVLDLKNPGDAALKRVEHLPLEEQVDALIPVDAVDLEDKLYFFNWCQGSSDDIATFRIRQAERLAIMEKKQSMENAASNSDRARPQA